MKREELEDTKGAIRIRISKKNRQHNGQKKKYKRTNNDKKHTYKTNDRVTRTRLKTGGELRCSGRVGSSCFTSDTNQIFLCKSTHARCKLLFACVCMNMDYDQVKIRKKD